MKNAMSLLPNKRVVALDLLERASLFVHLDPRREGVVVPKAFLNQPQLVLQIGLNMALAIPDLDVNDDGISCTLSFQRRPHFCVMPWRAIYALIGEGGGGMVWPEDVPPEVIEKQRGGAARERPRLRSVSSSAKSAQAQEEPSGSESSAEEETGIADEAPPQRSTEIPPPPMDRPSAPRLVALAGASDGSGDEEGEESTQQGVQSKRRRPPYLRLVE